MMLIVVYVGAVAVLFLFVVMLLDVDFAAVQAGLRAISAGRRPDRALRRLRTLVRDLGLVARAATPPPPPRRRARSPTRARSGS